MRYIKVGTRRAMVDEVDYDALMKSRWSLLSVGTGYAQRTERKDGQYVIQLMHRQLLGLTRGDGKRVDHINGNTLDNRRSNLRLVTPRQNAENQGTASHAHSRSAYRGVQHRVERSARPWRAQVFRDRKRVHSSYHETEIEAARAAQWARERFFGCNEREIPLT